MKRHNPLLLLACVCGLLFQTACSNILPGNDPVVVRAEQTIASSRDTVDAFLKAEKAFVAAKPDSSLAETLIPIANSLREKYPPSQSAALSALGAYKANKNETAPLESALKTLLDLVGIAQTAQAQIAAGK